MEREGVRVKCPLGGIAPCVDDLCNNVDHTLCGLEFGFDFCEHEFVPETCPECEHEDDGYDGFEDDERADAEEEKQQ